MLRFTVTNAEGTVGFKSARIDEVLTFIRAHAYETDMNIYRFGGATGSELTGEFAVRDDSILPANDDPYAEETLFPNK